LFLEARLIAADECDTDPSKDKYIFGNYREIKDTRSLIDRLYAQIMGSLSNKASKELLDTLDKKLQENVKETEVIRKESEAAKKIAEQVAENLKNNIVDIIEGVNPPTANLKDRKTLWQDISKGKPGILKLWKDGKWDPVVPDVESVKKETLEQVSKDIETTKSELNQKVQEAQKQATGQFNEVKESLQGVSRTISDVQNKQGEIDKKVTKFEQDSNGFKLSIESLTKKDTDISNKLNTVEQTVEGTKKTITDVQQTTNDLKKTTTEIKEQAGKISEKLTTVETKVNNDKAGGRNLLLDSNVKYEKTDYLINQYSLTENFSTGEEYTFVIKGSVLQGQKFGIWQNGGSNNVGYATSVYANGITYVTFKAVAATSGNERKLSLYNFPSNTTKAVVEWVALYKGNKPQDWTPAPENQVTNDEFTKRTTEIEKSVEGVKTTVSNVQNSQVGFEKRMSNVEQTASGLSTSVKQLTQTQTTQGKQITDANTKIEQQAQAIKAKVEIKQVEDYVGGFQIPELKNTVTKNAQDLMGEISKKVATQDYNKKTTELERLISVNAKGISLAAIKTEVYTKGQADGKYADKAYVEKQAGRIDVTEKAITSTVQKGTIISAINQTAEQIQIDVAKLKINADTIVQWLTAKGIDADVIKISGDKVTIDKNGITAKMADFFFEDERGQKFSVTPRKNLIPDHDFSHISFKNFNNYFLKIEYSPTWTIMSNPYIEKPVVNNYEPMVNPLRIDLGNWIRFTLFDGVKPGKKYTLSAHFRATTNDNRVNITNKPIMRAVFGKYNGDTPVELGRASKTYDAPSIQTGKIVRYALTFTVPSNYVEGNGYVYIDLFGEGLLNNMQAIAVSGVQLVEGDVPSVYNWDTTHGELVNGTLPFSTIALGTKDNVIYHNHVNKWNYMNAPLEIISNGEMIALVGDDRAGLSFYPRGGGERRSYIGHIYNNENRFRIESKDPVATTQSIECNGINVCGGYFGANAGSIHYTNGSLGLGWYFHDGRWNYVDFTNMTSRT
ncbi:TPA: hypothetical protein QCY29_005938, partial [Bacillus toyonensis]|nr:hypothetical protein [Bacillus toyonensis]